MSQYVFFLMPFRYYNSTSLVGQLCSLSSTRYAGATVVMLACFSMAIFIMNINIDITKQFFPGCHCIRTRFNCAVKWLLSRGCGKQVHASVCNEKVRFVVVQILVSSWRHTLYVPVTTVRGVCRCGYTCGYIHIFPICGQRIGITADRE